MAEICFETERAAEGSDLYERAIQISQSHLGPRHPDTVKALKGYAAALRKLDRIAEADAVEELIQDFRRADRRVNPDRRAQAREPGQGSDRRQGGDRRQHRHRPAVDRTKPLP
jgi:hypothetical protein